MKAWNYGNATQYQKLTVAWDLIVPDESSSPIESMSFGKAAYEVEVISSILEGIKVMSSKTRHKKESLILSAGIYSIFIHMKLR